MSAVTGHVHLVERKRGAKWYAKWRDVSGHQHQKCLGPSWPERSRPPAGYFTRKLAEEWLRETLVDARRGTGTVVSTRRTFREAVDGWLRYVEFDKARSGSTLDGYRSVAEAHLVPEFGADTPVAAITTDRIDAYRERLLGDEDTSRRTAQKILVELGSILGWAKRKKWIAENPYADAEKVQVRRSGDFNVLSPVEVQAVAAAACDELHGHLFTVAAFTGLRLGELRALRFADVDFTTRNVFVRFNKVGSRAVKRPKSHRVRSVPLIDQAAKALDALSRRPHYTEPDDLVFTEAGQPLDEGKIRDAFYAALEKAGLGHMRKKPEPITFHSLRHTLGTLGARVWPLHELRAYMGHADIQTTMVYVHHVPKTAAADALSKLIEAESAPVLDVAAPQAA